jgi:hypothetical protein
VIEIIHIAGGVVHVGSKLRQLCAWCGYALIDVDLSGMVTTDPDGIYGTWAPGALVAVDGPGSWVVPCETGDTLPLRCCASQRKLELVPNEQEKP